MFDKDYEYKIRSFPEDLADIDRGNYECKCESCGKLFQGFKRRVVCKLCDKGK